MNNRLFKSVFFRSCPQAAMLVTGLLLCSQVHALGVVDAKLEELADQSRVTLVFDQPSWRSWLINPV